MPHYRPARNNLQSYSVKLLRRLRQDDDNLVKKRSHSNLSQSQLTLDTFERVSLLHSLNSTQIKIAQHLISGYYPAMVARKLNISRSYLSRFVHKLLDANLIAVGYKDSLQRRAVVYDISKELSDYIFKIEQKTNVDLTLCTPHNIRYKYNLTNTSNKPIAIDIGRFAHSKWKYIRTFSPKGSNRYVFSNDGLHGEYKIIVHPHSLEILCGSRKHIPARSIEEATNLLSMSLNEAAHRFCDEQNWCAVSLELGKPQLVGSIHYAFKSKDLKKIVNQSGTLKQIGDFELDKSPEAEGDMVHVELETVSKSSAEKFDNALRMVPKVHDELQSMKDAILGINNIAEQITNVQNNVQALCMSGTPISNQFSMLQTIVARQGESIHLMQSTMLALVENMGKILDKMNIS